MSTTNLAYNSISRLLNPNLEARISPELTTPEEVQIDLENPQTFSVPINRTFKVCLILSANYGNTYPIPKRFSKSTVFENVNNGFIT